MQTQAQGRAISVDEWSIDLLKSVPCVCVRVLVVVCIFNKTTNTKRSCIVRQFGFIKCARYESNVHPSENCIRPPTARLFFFFRHYCHSLAIFLQHPYLQHVCDAMAQAPARTHSCIAAGMHSCIAQAASSFIHSHPGQRGASKQSPSHTDTEQIKENEAPLPPFCVASIGGGGGSDAVGLIIFRNFLREKPTALKGVDRALCVWVYDVEEGWKEAVEEIPCTMRRVGIQCQFDQVCVWVCGCVGV